MGDTTVKKVDSKYSPHGPSGETYLESGKHIAMRLWHERPGADKPATTRDYETVGYVISGRAEVELEGQTIRLEPGNCWVVPKGATHRYRILEDFTAVEATSPPYHVHGRDK